MSEKRVITKQEILAGLAGLGVKHGFNLLVHSSLSKVGYIDGGVPAFIDALVTAVGSEGTVLVPTLTGNELLSKENPPVFDPENSPCWTGQLPETFRQRKDAIRSLHPTHSVAAVGKHAGYFTAGHEDSLLPCGKESPYWKLAEKNGYYLFVGVNLDSCTFMHTLEEITGVPYHLQVEKVSAKIITGKSPLTRDLYIHKYGTRVYFAKVEPLLLEKGALIKGKIGEAEALLLDAAKTAEILLPILANDKFFFTKEG
ncbi:MAG: AAC(3) family N-acetyltransferase [Candidatus Firestonebacteria bacterium]